MCEYVKFILECRVHKFNNNECKINVTQYIVLYDKLNVLIVILYLEVVCG